MREWVGQSAEGWIRDFGIDGLRLDAIHAIFDSSAEHIVAKVARRVHQINPSALVIAESGLNDPKVMRPRERGGYDCDAAWADDFHHALRTLDDRRARRLLRRVRQRRTAGQGLSPAPRARRRVLELSPPALRRASQRHSAGAVRGLLTGPRPGRQPGLR